MSFTAQVTPLIALLGIAMMLMAAWTFVLRLTTKPDRETFAKAGGLFLGGVLLVLPFVVTVHFAIAMTKEEKPSRRSSPTAGSTPTAISTGKTPR